MKGLLYRLRLLTFGAGAPNTTKKDAKPEVRAIVMKYARGNVNLKRGSYITASKVEQQRELLSKCQF